MCLGFQGHPPPPPPSPLPASLPPPSRKKKNSEKKSSAPSPPLPPLLIGNGRERSEKISRLDSKSHFEFQQATKPHGDLELSPGRRSSNQTRTVHQRSTNQNRPHCTATYLGQLSLHLPHKVAPALFGPLPLLSLSPTRLVCPGVNMISDPNPLLLDKVRLRWVRLG